MKEVKGLCCICGKNGELSFEHIPPKYAFNDKPAFIQNYDHLIDEESYLYGKQIRSHRGLGGYTLCKNCNSKTGGWYGKDFGVFSQQGMKLIMSYDKPQLFLFGEYKIKPLSVLKQIMSMFMSADKTGSLRSSGNISEFILDKESKILDEKYKVYLYSTLGPKYRFFGHSISLDTNTGEACKWSEINFKPFGFFLTEDSPPPIEHMLDITPFKTCSYGEESVIRLKTIFLVVNDILMGTYY